MCGIVGIINRENLVYQSDKLVKYFTQALYVDALRGRHGTGIIGVTDKGDVNTYKKALCSNDFLELDTTKKIIDKDNVFLVGHNRFATQGAHTSENSHPFSHGHIHMVHNGTLDFYKSLTPGKNFTVDSDTIAYLLSESNNPKDVLETLEGAFSLVWYDEIEETLNFARNKERPMFYGVLKKSGSIVFGSEYKMIEWLTDRIGIELEEIYDIGIGRLLSIPLNLKTAKATITKFKPKEPVNYYKDYPYTYKATNFPKKKYSYLENMEYVDVVVDSWAPYQSSAHSPEAFGFLTGNYNKNLEIEVSSIKRSNYKDYLGKSVRVKIYNVQSDVKCLARLISLTPESEINNEPINNVINYEDLTDQVPALLKGPDNKDITLAQFNELVKCGCTSCNQELTIKDSDDILWDYDDPYCVDCSEAILNKIL